jgi:hypothetical protein
MTFSIKVILHQHKILLDHANSGREGLTRAVAGKDSAFPRLALAVRLLFFPAAGRRRERTRGRAAEQRYERAAPHSITSSARASSAGGTVRPRPLAVFKLMISSTFVACCTGNAETFSPRRIRAT